MRKQIMTLAVVIALSSTGCMAQSERPQHGGPRENMMEKMKTELSLSDEQVAKMKEVFKDMRPGKTGKRPSREEMEKKREEMESKVKKILTEEQYTKYQKMHREQRRPPREKKGE